MKVVIAGCRWIQDYSIVCEAIEASNFKITRVVSGVATGVDTLGENWAEANDIKVKQFPADWKSLKVPGAIIKTNQYGKYNAAAGHIRNEKMAQYSEGLIAIWDGESRGTADMILKAHKYGLEVFVFLVEATSK